MLALNLSPLTIEDGIKKCSALFAASSFAECLSLAEEMSGIYPDHVDFKYTMALCYKEFKKYDESEVLLLECLNKVPDSINVLFNLGLLYSSLKDITKALFYYEKALAVNPNHIGLLNNLANIYNDIGRNNDALNLFGRILELGYTESFIHNNIALIYKKIGKLNEALAHINEAIKSNNNDYRIYHTAALILMAMANNNQAINCLEKALQLNPDNIQINYEYSDLLNKVCQWDKYSAVQSKLKELLKTNNQEFIMAPMADIQHNIDPAHNLEIANKFTDSIVKPILATHQPFKFDITRKAAKAKIRIGYLSSDIKDHPVAHLTRGVFQKVY
ncbi:MAG: UDP-N-acetylglucosamine--peptide N-acetylglucosaminyltransferase kDa subunit-like [Rickettsiaceae bacterium]|nr:UDP-N-acetylglucosamine--peptide N-acetylglucosaminyltransferase kDa subunit-like [Rickettsiaceae bacterium]